MPHVLFTFKARVRFYLNTYNMTVGVHREGFSGGWEYFFFFFSSKCLKMDKSNPLFFNLSSKTDPPFRALTYGPVEMRICIHILYFTSLHMHFVFHPQRRHPTLYFQTLKFSAFALRYLPWFWFLLSVPLLETHSAHWQCFECTYVRMRTGSKIEIGTDCLDPDDGDPSLRTPCAGICMVGKRYVTFHCMACTFSLPTYQQI